MKDSAASPEASAYLAAIIEGSDDAIISKNLDGIILSWNRSAEHMYGYTAAEAVGKHITLIIPQDRHSEEQDIIARLRRGEKIDHYETIRKRKDGGLVDVSLTVSPVRNREGKIIAASKIARDITEQKKIREELRAQREWFAVTLASIGDAVIATDTHACVTYLNPVAERLTGWSVKEALGKPLPEVFNIINEDTRLPAENPVDKVIRLGMIQGLANHTALLSKDGTEYAIDDAAAPIRKANGDLIGVVMVFHDIGDRRVLEKDLQKHIEALAERDRRKDEFLAMLAHELRNPLAPISNASHIMRSSTISDNIRNEASQMVERQIKQMTQLLDDLLDVSRVTLGKIELRRQPVELKTIMEMALETTKPLMEERQHTVNLHLPPEPIWLNADATRLAQVFSNLLNNAAKYTDKGGRITIDVIESNGEAVIKIRDNGIGIPANMLPQIFELFAQVDSSLERAQGGLGIGLTLVKNLVEMHAGSVIAYSEGKAKGSEFIVRLPLQKKAQLSVNIPAREDMPAGTDAAYRILVVDDNVASAKTLGWMIEMLGHEVQLAHNGTQALEKAHQFLPHVILLDIGLPGMNGYEVCEALRKDALFENTMIIAQTGWGQEEHKFRSQKAGFNYHLVKPVQLEALQQLLAKMNFPVEAAAVQTRLPL